MKTKFSIEDLFTSTAYAAESKNLFYGLVGTFFLLAKNEFYRSVTVNLLLVNQNKFWISFNFKGVTRG